jgi:hypothetical protein
VASWTWRREDPFVDGDAQMIAVNSLIMIDLACDTVTVPTAEALRLVEAAAR